MNCPKCGVGKLGSETVEINEASRDPVLRGEGLKKTIEVNQCFVCGGIWFDAGELEAIIKEKINVLGSESIDPDIDDGFETKIAKCPRCNIDMVKKKAPADDAVTCDYCEKCHGIWLDSGKIEKLEVDTITFKDRINLLLEEIRAKFSKS